MFPRVVFDRSLPPAEISVLDAEPIRATVWLVGEVDGECAAALAAELQRQRAASRRLVRVDMHSVTFLDSAALGVLVDAHHRFLAMRGTLVLCGVSGVTMRLLRLTGMDRELLHMPPVA